MKIILLFIFCFLSLTSCSKKSEDHGQKYTVEEFNKILTDTGAIQDKKVTNINFADYSIGVNRINSRAMEYQRLGFYVIEFETEKQARQEAIRLNQYYSRNWLFDRTDGEPILEDYVILNFLGISPNRSIQRKPKTQAAPAHGEGHGENHGATPAVQH
jgi:hypothetical protein